MFSSMPNAWATEDPRIVTSRVRCGIDDGQMFLKC